MKRSEIQRAADIAADPEWDAHVSEKLSHFGNKAGQHGPDDAVVRPSTIRLGKGTDRDLALLARALGTRKASLIAQLCEVAAQCPRWNWYRAVSAFQSAAAGRGKLDEVAAGR